MTAPDPRVGEIEVRLNAATPGPWEEFWRGHIHAKGEVETISVCQTFGPEDQIHPNAEFIANSPADVAYLLAELRKRDEGGQYALEINAEGYPRNVGPFPTRAAAEAWMEGRKLTGSWNVFPLTCPT